MAHLGPGGVYHLQAALGGVAVSEYDIATHIDTGRKSTSMSDNLNVGQMCNPRETNVK